MAEESFAFEDEAPLERVSFASPVPGPKLLITGGVHGNETCGPIAIGRAIEDIRSGQLKLRRGLVTFVPVCNPRAYRLNTREGDRNLNRDMQEKPLPQNYEDAIGNRLISILREHEALLDIHSFKGEGVPFVFYGPADNSGALEPFRHGAAESAFAACLGVEIMIHGWLHIFEKLVNERVRLGLPRLPVTEGFGTTEFMRFSGGYGVTLECGRHDDPQAPEVGYRAIVNVLAHLELIDAPAPAYGPRTAIELIDMLICEREGDRVEGTWRTGDPVAAGTVIARRASGEAVTAPRDGYFIFANPNAKPGESLGYFGVKSSRTV